MLPGAGGTANPQRPSIDPCLSGRRHRPWVLRDLDSFRASCGACSIHHPGPAWCNLRLRRRRGQILVCCCYIHHYPALQIYRLHHHHHGRSSVDLFDLPYRGQIQTTALRSRIDRRRCETGVGRRCRALFVDYPVSGMTMTTTTVLSQVLWTSVDSFHRAIAAAGRGRLKRSVLARRDDPLVSRGKRPVSARRCVYHHYYFFWESHSSGSAPQHAAGKNSHPHCPGAPTPCRDCAFCLVPSRHRPPSRPPCFEKSDAARGRQRPQLAGAPVAGAFLPSTSWRRGAQIWRTTPQRVVLTPPPPPFPAQPHAGWQPVSPKKA